ncbi:hypothetical protein J7L87_04765, partial [bacterium]|nr:hypothetical protein [bacterium]
MKRIMFFPFFCFIGILLAGENFVVNGNFEKGIDGWYGMKLVRKGKKLISEKSPEFLSLEDKDTYKNSKHSLRVKIKFGENETGASHNTGAVCKLKKGIPAGNILKVSFAAKSIKGPAILNIVRMWGGKDFENVEITDKWKKYEVELEVEYDTSEIIFNLVPEKTEKIQKVVEGSFLLDNVSVEISGKAKETSKITEKETTSLPAIGFLFPSAHDLAYVIDPQIVSYLEKKGFVINKLLWENTDYRKLSQYDFLIVFGFGKSNPDYSIPENVKKRFGMLKKYVEEGGSVWINVHLSADMRDYQTTKKFLEIFGATPLLVNIRDIPHERILPPWYIKFAYTQKINTSLINLKGKGLWYPVDMYKLGPRSFVFRFSNQWKVLISTESTSTITPIFVRIPFFDKQQNEKERNGSFPLIGLKKEGKGKMIVSGFYYPYLFADAFAPALGRVMLDKGFNNKKSCGLELLEKLSKWATKNYNTIKRNRIAKTPDELKKPIFSERCRILNEFNWKNARYPELKWRKGAIFIVPVSIPLSSFIRKAKENGLNFVVCVRKADEIGRKSLDEFKKECEKLSDGKFAVIPGIYLKDIMENNFLAIGEKITFPDPAIWDSKRKRIKPPKKGEIPGALEQLGDAYLHYVLTQMHHSVITASLLHNENKIPYDDYRDYNAIAIITTRDGKVVDNITDGYLRLQDRGENLVPLSVHFITTLKSIDKIIKNKNWLFYLSENPVSYFSRGHMFENPSTYISSGPEINYWMWKGPRDFENVGNHFDISRWYYMVKVEVKSEKGLKEIKIYDGEEIFRRYIVDGKKIFKTEIPLFHTRQKNLILIAEDLEGKKAISAEVFDRNHIAEEFMCSDRNNQLFYSMQRRNTGICFPRSLNSGITPNKGPWSGEITPWAPLTQDPLHRLTVVGFDGGPSGSAVVFFLPGNAFYGKERPLRSNPFRILNSMDIAIGKSILNTGFPENSIPSNVWHSILPVVPTKLIDGEFKEYYFIPRPETDLPAFLIECKIKFKKDYTPPKYGKLLFNLALLDTRKATTWQIRTSDGKFYAGIRNTGRPSTEEFMVPFGPGSYVRAGEGPTGSTTIFSLTENLYLYGLSDLWRAFIGLPNTRRKIKKGEEFKAKFLLIGEPFNGIPGNKVIENIYKTFFTDKSELEIKNITGKLKKKGYPVEVIAEKGIWEGEIKANTYISIPLVIKNLNPGIPAYVYFPEIKKFRPVAVDENGNGYLSISGKTKEKIIVGNILRVSEKNINISGGIIEGNKLLL